MSVATERAIEPMTREQLDVALEWAAREGWNPGLHDADAFWATDRQGFFVAEHEGQPVGSVSAVAYDEHFGFAGLFLVRPEYRGRRIGVELARRALEHLDGRTIGLDGVVAKQGNYRHFGFQFAHRTIRYRGLSPDARTHDVPVSVVNLTTLPLVELAAYDRWMYPANRPAFLERWIHSPGSAALGIMRFERLAGYGVVRPCRCGYRVGPLMADASELAEVLLDALLAKVPGAAYSIDVPEPNSAAMAMVKRRGMQAVFETARMYRGAAPRIDIDHVYGQTTLELG
jgi:GNAT superfamily N-acetyltransferase